MKRISVSPLFQKILKNQFGFRKFSFTKFMNTPYFFLILICGFLTIIWFRNHTYLFSGEEIFEIYNPLRSLRLDSNPWLYLTGSNLPSVSLYLTRLPFFLLTSVFFISGFPGWMIQALSYFILMNIGTIGVALLAKEFSSAKKTFLIPFIAGAFYLLNPYSMSQVWGRFIYNGMFAWALLPIALLTLYKWLHNGQKRWLILFGIFSLLLSHAYANPGFIVAIWLPLSVLMGLSTLKLIRKKIPLKSMIFRIIVTLLCWLLINIWWIYPYAIMWRSVFSQVSGWQANLNSLLGVSQYFPTDQIILLKQSFLFQGTPLYAFWFSQWWVLGIEWLVLLFVLIGIAVSLKKRLGIYLLVLFFVGWVFVKGTNHPLGNLFYTFLFKNFTFMGAVRNSYEKLGVDWLLPYSIFFAFGFNWLSDKYTWVKSGLVAFLLIFIFGFAVMPMWTGQLFGAGEFNTVVHVPTYYQQANVYLNSLSKNNLFDLPFLAGDGINYIWGFGGTEPSEFLFDRISISKILRVKYYDDFYLALQTHLGDKNFPKLLGVLGVRNIILHKDEVIGTNSASLVRQSEEDLNTWHGVSYNKTFGKLAIYSIDKSLVVPVIYSPTNVVYVPSLQDGLDYLLNRSNPTRSVFITRKLEDSIMNNLGSGQITFKQLSSTHYQVKVYGAKKDYLLVLDDVYNGNWLLAIAGKPVHTHVLVNGLSNGWVLSQRGSYTIDIQLKIWPWEK